MMLSQFFHSGRIQKGMTSLFFIGFVVSMIFPITVLQAQTSLTSTGTLGNYLLAYPASLSSSGYQNGMMVTFKANHANSAGAATIKINTLAVIPIKKQVTVDLLANEILANQVVTLIYDGTNFQLLSITGGNASSPWSLAGNTDTDSLINFLGTGTTANSSFGIRTNNTTRMYFRRNGNIGIGTLAPATQLHVKGFVRFEDASSSNSASFSASGFDGGDFAIMAANRHLTLNINSVALGRLRLTNTAGTEVFNINGTGNVSINNGVTPATYPLQVGGTSGIPNVLVGSLAGTGNRVIYAMADGRLNDTTFTSITNAWALDGNTNGSIKFIGTKDAFDFPVYTNNNERLRITSSGQFLHGLTTPIGAAAAQLRNSDAATNSVSPVLSLDHSSSATSVAGFGTGMVFKGQNGAGIKGVDMTSLTSTFSNVTSGSESANLTFSNIATGTMTPVLRINANGAVGIGTAASTGPTGGTMFDLNTGISTLLKVATTGSSQTASIVIERPNNTSAALLRFTHSGLVNKWVQGMQIGSDDYLIYDFVNNNYSMFISATAPKQGYIGLGTNAPAMRFHVAGFLGKSGVRFDTLAGVGFGLVKTNVNGDISRINYTTVTDVLRGDGTFGVAPSSGWNLTGNSVTTANSKYIGTNDNFSLRFATNNVEAARIDSLGRLLIGVGYLNQPVKLAVGGNGNGAIGIVNAANTSFGGSSLFLGRARGTLASQSSVFSGDMLGTLVFGGFDGSTLSSAGNIESYATESWTGASRGSNMVFSVTKNGSILKTPAITINQSTNVGIEVSAPTSKLQVNGDIGLGDGTMNGNTYISINLTNSGALVNAGDIVVVSGGTLSFTTTTDVESPSVLGVAAETINPGSTGRVAIGGVIQVSVKGGVNIGEHVITSDTDGKAIGILNPASGASLGLYLSTQAASKAWMRIK